MTTPTHCLEKKINLDLALPFLPDFYIRYKTGRFKVWPGNSLFLVPKEMSVENKSKHLENSQSNLTRTPCFYILCFTKLLTCSSLNIAKQSFSMASLRSTNTDILM